MPTFAANFSSSSLPSTPDSRQKPRRGIIGVSPGSQPSTTPAGPPPSGPFFGSLTPAGPPPVTPFGSSIFASGDAAPKSSLTSPAYLDKQPAKPYWLGRAKNGTPARLLRPRLSRTPESEIGSDGDDEDEEDEDFEQPAAAVLQPPSSLAASDLLGFDSPSRRQTEQLPVPDLLQSLSESRGMKRPRSGGDMGQHLRAPPSIDREPSPVALIARDKANRMGPGSLREEDDMILGTEDIIERLESQELDSSDRGAISNDPAASASREVLQYWQTYCDNGRRKDHSAGIGPDERSSPVTKAVFVADFLLSIHHPPPLQVSNALSQSRTGRSQGYLRAMTSAMAGRSLPLPKVLLDWLDTHHNSLPGGVENVLSHQPNPSDHAYFWEIALSAVLRGKLEDAVRLLREVDFSLDGAHGSRQSEHTAQRLTNMRQVVKNVIQTLEDCPAVRKGNWSLVDDDWAAFRLRASMASRDLTQFVEATDPDKYISTTEPFAAEHFGISRDKRSSYYSNASKEAGSRIPWKLYRHLKGLYGVLEGNAAEIMSLAQDWIEATLGLTVWWDGQSDSSSSRRGQIQRASNAGPHHLEQLAWSYRYATSGKTEGSFQVNTMNQVELGLVAVIDGDIEGAIGTVRTWSMVVASALVRIGRRGGWLDPYNSEEIINEFDQSDLMVLDYAQGGPRSWKDEVLFSYADGLIDRGRLHRRSDSRVGTGKQGEVQPVEPEGWELAMQVLARMANTQLATKKISELLDRVPLQSARQVDRVVNICREIGLDGQADKVAEKYADLLAEGSYRYGETLIYYARAHQRRKLKNVVDLLISYSLIQSAAYPAEPELDEQLRLLIASPKQALTKISQGDGEAAEMLQHHLSGYATLRTFYGLRDEHVNRKPGEKPRLGVSARKKQALAVLLAIITSAADSIHGGLYDQRRGSVTSVDALLVLLGETMVFIEQPTRLVTVPQIYDMLKAIEDLETVTTKVFSRCEELFQATVSSAQGNTVSSPKATLKQSLSFMTSSTATAFSMIGSSMLMSAHEKDDAYSHNHNHNDNDNDRGDTDKSSRKAGPREKKNKKSKPIIKSGSLRGADERMADVGFPRMKESQHIQRGWDWRAGLPPKVSGTDLIQMLRLSLGRELARAWLDGQ